MTSVLCEGGSTSKATLIGLQATIRPPKLRFQGGESIYNLKLPMASSKFSVQIDVDFLTPSALTETLFQYNEVTSQIPAQPLKIMRAHGERGCTRREQGSSALRWSP